MRKLSITLLLIFFSLSCIKEKQTGADLVIGDSIPDFTVTMNDGTKMSGAYLREGVSCIVFFTTLCPDCQQTLPHVQRIYDEYLSQGHLSLMQALLQKPRLQEEGPKVLLFFSYTYWFRDVSTRFARST